MEIIRIPRIVQDTCNKHRMKGRSVGFVPTMGALHGGHLSLIKRSRMENDITIASIFVNPIQFGPAEDLAKYPRDIEDDVRKLREHDIDMLFLPDDGLMYPKGFETRVEAGHLAKKLCGRFRPGHFNGVATVVAKLFNITSPTRAYFGQKDFQQALIIKRMARDLNFNIETVVCPIIREHDGLAMSSRNRYLDEEQRTAASKIFRGLNAASAAIHSGGSVSEIRSLMVKMLSSEPLITQIDYASIYDPETLDEVTEIKDELLLAVAARLGETRLIDNMLVNVS
ncbi:MAG: pantoate--beta-alanine ligase [Nitrospirae bacterium]|nr:pantoate--beta-alanine ligase [Nitrospirota bacterium]